MTSIAASDTNARIPNDPPDLSPLTPNRASAASEGGSQQVADPTVIPATEAPEKSVATSVIKWHAPSANVRGGLKLADSPPRYKIPDQMACRGPASEVRAPHQNVAPGACHFACHLVSRSSNGTRYGRWSR